MKYSIVTATARGIEELIPLFISPNKDAELIIIPKKWDETIRDWLSNQEGYAQIVYPPPEIVYHYPTILQQQRNTGITYAEGERLIMMDDAIELKRDFWKKLDQSTKYFPKHAILLQKLHQVLGERKWINTFANANKAYEQRYFFVNDPRFTFSFGAVLLGDMLDINGYDILYDMGWWYDDTILLARMLRKGVSIIYDTHCMGYKFEHLEIHPPFHVNKWLYEIDLERCQNGQTHAYNPYVLRQLREQKLQEKDKWIVRRLE